MSYGLQQTAAELKLLVGATVTSVKKRRGNPAEFSDDCLAITFKLPTNHPPVDDGEGTVGRTVTYEVWQDPEGNGPGFLAFTKLAK